MDTQELTPEIEEMANSLEEQYVYLRSNVQKNYIYHRSPAHIKAFRKAAKFCLEAGFTAEEYSVALMDSLGNHRENFFPSYFGSSTANQHAMTYREDRAIPLDMILEQQKTLLGTHVLKLKKDPIAALMDPRLKFYAWFRVVATREPNHEIIRVYRETAREELTPALAKFLRDNNLDIDRIYG
jgi:hypothetical protein